MKKGFTLVELLAVIVILAVLITLSIPLSSRAINEVRKSAFSKYAEKLYTSSITQFESDANNDLSLSYYCKVYDIKDIGIDNVGNYQGYVVVKPSTDSKKVYITYRDNKFYLLHYDYSEGKVLDNVNKYISNDYHDGLTERQNFLFEIGCYNTKYSASINQGEFEVSK